MKHVIPALIVSTSLLSACAGFVPTVISDSDRDSQNTFDGRWNLNIAPRVKINKSDNSDFRNYPCTIEKATVVLNVLDGIARIEGEHSDLIANVATDGRFRLEMPTDQNFRKRNGLTGFNSMLTIVYKGTLSDQGSTGVFVHGRGASTKTDCSTSMSIEKVS